MNSNGRIKRTITVADSIYECDGIYFSVFINEEQFYKASDVIIEAIKKANEEYLMFCCS
jgi:hypothetical protein